MSAREGALDARRVRVVARWDVIAIVGIYIVGLVDILATAHVCVDVDGK